MTQSLGLQLTAPQDRPISSISSIYQLCNSGLSFFLTQVFSFVLKQGNKAITLDQYNIPKPSHIHPQTLLHTLSHSGHPHHLLQAHPHSNDLRLSSTSQGWTLPRDCLSPSPTTDIPRLKKCLILSTCLLPAL